MFGRRRAGRSPNAGDRAATRADRDHLAQFAAGHPGVEAYLEPATSVLGTTVVLVAATGEWTRRRVDDPDAARRFAQKHAVPLYDVTLTSYPARMRAWTAARGDAGGCRAPGLRGRNDPPR